MLSFWVNEKKQTVEEDLYDLCLLDYLRNKLGLMGSKRGCETGACGACTIIIDGKASKSCTTKLGKMEGRKVMTIEGIAVNGKLHPVQDAFVECSAVQCGFCTPGMIMSALALIDKNPDPSDEEITKALRGNLCRCGTYPRVITAIQRAAAVMRGENIPDFLPKEEQTDDIGGSAKRIDFKEKVTGETVFTSDLEVENMLHGKVIFSKYPHAELLNIDKSEAEKMDGVELILTLEDVPGEKLYGIMEKDQPVLSDDRVRYTGEPVAVVFAKTMELAEKAAEAVNVEYRELPGVFSIEEALAPNAPKLHPEGNIIDEIKFEHGDVEKAFAEADVVVDETFHTQPIEHAFMETEGALSIAGDNGKVIVYLGVQRSFNDRDQLADILGKKPEEVIVRNIAAGGSFGVKTEMLSVYAYSALGAMLTGRPAKLILNRKESLKYHSKRHSYDLRYRIAAKNDGKILAMDIDAVSEGGAYRTWSPDVLYVSAIHCTGPFSFPNLRFNGKTVYTNNLIAGSMRGFGANQMLFAVDSVLNILGEKLGIEPLDIRRINAWKKGTASGFGEKHHHVENYEKTLDIIEDVIKTDLKPLTSEKPNTGIGIGTAYRSVGCSEATGSVKLEFSKTGRILLKNACSDIGQGSTTSLCQIAAHVTGTRLEDMEVVENDSSVVPEATGTLSMGGVYVNGIGVMRAGEKLREKIIDEAAILLEKEPESLNLTGGNIVDLKNSKQYLTLKELGEQLNTNLEIEEYYKMPRVSCDFDKLNTKDPSPHDDWFAHTYSSCTCAAAVDVDETTGKVEVLKIVVALDIGRIINPEAVRTQVEGAAFMGIGFALTEEYKVEKGIVKTDTFGKYKMPRITDNTEIVTIFSECDEPSGPFGSKGVGELPAIAVAPAIINAVYDATGTRIKTLPAGRQLKRD